MSICRLDLLYTDFGLCISVSSYSVHCVVRESRINYNGSAHEALAAVYCLEPHACRSAPTHTNARSDFKLQLLDVRVGLDALHIIGRAILRFFYYDN